MIRQTVVAALVTISSAVVAGAQSAERSTDATQPQRGARAGIEQQLRQRFAQRTRSELGLNGDQMLKLAEVNHRFGQQQRGIDQRELQTRQALRQALMETPTADQDRRVGELHDQLLQLQRQRFDVIVAEQKELGGFMSNVQRVRFQALQENFRRQLQEALNPSGPAGRRGRPPI